MAAAAHLTSAAATADAMAAAASTADALTAATLADLWPAAALGPGDVMRLAVAEARLPAL